MSLNLKPSVMLALALLIVSISISTSTPASSKEMKFELFTGIPDQKVELATDLSEWARSPMLETAPGSYSRSIEEPWLPQIEYKFVVDGTWIADPANSKTMPDGQGALNSVVAVSGFHEDPLLQPQPGVPALVESKLRLTDREGSARMLTVLSPSAGSESSVTIYFQDGGDYLERTGVKALLANLALDPSLPAMTAVFIPPKDRMREYRMLPVYADWVARDVVPAVEAQYPATGGARTRRLLIGPSLGGLITVYTALRHPQVFGHAASQSGSLWLDRGKLLAALSAPISTPQDRLKLFLDCGTYEDSDMPKYNRLGFDAAHRAGHDVVYHEYPSTHDWLAWRNRLQETFRYFFAKN